MTLGNYFWSLVVFYLIKSKISLSYHGEIEAASLKGYPALLIFILIKNKIFINY